MSISVTLLNSFAHFRSLARVRGDRHNGSVVGFLFYVLILETESVSSEPEKVSDRSGAFVTAFAMNALPCWPYCLGLEGGDEVSAIALSQ